jgi:hypothetical protein
MRDWQSPGSRIVRRRLRLKRRRGKYADKPSSEVRRKLYILRGLAFALVAFAAVAFLARPHSLGMRLWGLLAIFIGMWVARRSNEYARRAGDHATAEWSPADESKRVGPLMWAITAASLAACGVFYYAMYVDQLHGGRQAWPADAFAGAGIVFALTAATIAAKLSR